MSATSLKLHYEPQFGICIFMDRTGSQVVFSCMCTAHCLTLARVMSWVRCTATLSFTSPLLLFFVLPYLQLVNRLSQENLMAHLSTFLPALLDAFENHSPYVHKVVNPLPLFSTDSVFNKALSFWAHVLIVLHLLEFTCTKRL